MGLMDMVSGLLGKKTPKSGNSILDSLLPMLAGGGALGGLSGLIGKFSGAGLGAKANSWVGTGPNEALEPHEVGTALGDDTINQLAQQSGKSADEVKGGLASMLPNLVNHLTPGGSVPSGGLGGMMKGLDFSKILGGLGQ
jgi:uncharacterized protein YidB (DUF937 family)